MINNYKQLTSKYLKANRKRTILTIIGIILSVALISSICLFFKGIQEAHIDDFRNTYGSFHLSFGKVDDSLISKIENNPKVSRSGLMTFGEEIKIGKRLVVTPVFTTNEALEILPCRIKEGKMPEKKDEVAIQKWALKYLDKDARLGEKIKIGGKEYILSGLLEDGTKDQADGRVLLLSKSKEVDKENAMLLVEISSKTNLEKALKELEELGEKETVSRNHHLILVQGGYSFNSEFRGLYITLFIIIGIVLISTIAVIYNAFQISVVERIRQFGLLRAVGTTPKQIRWIVLREATILAVIGVPIGLVCGVVAIYAISIVFKLIGGDTVFSMEPSISPMILGLSGLVGLVSIYLSAFIPALFAGRISPLVAISSRTSITKEKIKRRKNIIIGKIFGFEGALAAKNMKRSRKRYRITVFSIVISVVLFITFKSFMDMSLNISDSFNESGKVHFSVFRDSVGQSEGVTIDNNIIDNIEAVKFVDKVYKIYEPFCFNIAVDNGSEIKEIQAMKNIYSETVLNGSKKTLMRGSIAIYDDNSMEAAKKYLDSGAIDVERLNKENGVIVIKKNTIHNDATEKNYFGPIADVKVGDEIDLQYDKESEDKVEFGKGEVKKVKVMAVVEADPFSFRGAQHVLKMITTQEVAMNLTEIRDIKPVSLHMTIKDIKDEYVALTEIENIVASNSSLRVINNLDMNRTEKTAILMVQILIYGFVVVVSLIGSVNIVNTLTTNIILRKREFATLKCIGLTQRGLKKMIVLEGLLYGIVGTIYGSVIGCGFSYLISKGLYSVREFGWSIPWDAMAMAGISAIIIGYISVLSPLSRIKKENLIEAVREE